MADLLGTHTHTPVPQPDRSISPPSDINTYTIDGAAYLAERYPDMRPPPRKDGLAVIITDEQRRQANANNRRKKAEKRETSGHPWRD